MNSFEQNFCTQIAYSDDPPAGVRPRGDRDIWGPTDAETVRSLSTVRSVVRDIPKPGNVPRFKMPALVAFRALEWTRRFRTLR
jgi:hypothetical protein